LKDLTSSILKVIALALAQIDHLTHLSNLITASCALDTYYQK